MINQKYDDETQNTHNAKKKKKKTHKKHSKHKKSSSNKEGSRKKKQSHKKKKKHKEKLDEKTSDFEDLDLEDLEQRKRILQLQLAQAASKTETDLILGLQDKLRGESGGRKTDGKSVEDTHQSSRDRSRDDKNRSRSAHDGGRDESLKKHR